MFHFLSQEACIFINILWRIVGMTPPLSWGWKALSLFCFHCKNALLFWYWRTYIFLKVFAKYFLLPFVSLEVCLFVCGGVGAGCGVRVYTQDMLHTHYPMINLFQRHLTFGIHALFLFFFFCFVFVLFCFVLFVLFLFCFVLFWFCFFVFFFRFFLCFVFCVFCFVFVFVFVLFLFCFVLFCFVLFCFVLFCYVLFFILNIWLFHSCFSYFQLLRNSSDGTVKDITEAKTKYKGHV